MVVDDFMDEEKTVKDEEETVSKNESISSYDSIIAEVDRKLKSLHNGLKKEILDEISSLPRLDPVLDKQIDDTINNNGGGLALPKKDVVDPAKDIIDDKHTLYDKYRDYLRKKKEGKVSRKGGR